MSEFLGTINIQGEITNPQNNNCVVCTKSWSKPDVGNISFVAENGEMLTYFFRFHKSCWNKLSEEEQHLIESSFVDNLKQ